MKSIVIFGPVAAGKSTLAAALVAAMPASCMLAEPTDQLQKFGLIEDLAANRPGSGLAVQMTVLMTRLRDMLRAADTNFSGASVIVCDGHVCLDGKLYNPEHIYCGRMNITDVCVYEHALDVTKTLLLPEVIRSPALYVYMRTSAAECVRRCKERNRRGERGLPQAYFTRMLQNCDAAADDIPNVLRLTEAVSTADAVAKIRERMSAV